VLAKQLRSAVEGKQLLVRPQPWETRTAMMMIPLEFHHPGEGFALRMSPGRVLECNGVWDFYLLFHGQRRDDTIATNMKQAGCIG